VTSVVAHGETGFLTPVDQGDSLAAALCELAGDPECVSRMGDAARLAYTRAFSLELMSERYAAAFRALIAND
jgi:glycosyltransferase involved in cell wall biosynthesis